MTTQTDSAGNQPHQRIPNLSRFGIALVEHLVSQIIGDSALDELKKPYLEKQTFDSLCKAIANTEEQFIAQYPNKAAGQTLLQLPIHDLPSVQKELWNFYKRPNDKGLESVLVTRLVELKLLDKEENKKVVNSYLKILRREFVNINPELRDKIQALAVLDIAEAVGDLKNLLDKNNNEGKILKSTSFERIDAAQLILDGEFEEFDEARVIETVAVLAVLLHIEPQSIKVLRVLPGSIILEIELESSSLNLLASMIEENDYRLINLGVIGLRLSNGKVFASKLRPQYTFSKVKDFNQTKPNPKFGIITALPEEAAAVETLLQKTRNIDFSTTVAGNSYLLGEIPAKDGGKHLVALASLVDMGNNFASTRTTQLLHHFPSVHFIIMVGIAGGVPCPHKPDDHVRLGDIVVSDRRGVVQYDLTKETITEIDYRYPPRPPNAFLLERVRSLEALEIKGRRPWLNRIKYALKKLKTSRPLDDRDILVSTENPETILVHPPDLKRVSGEPRVFIGTIGSANILLKDPHKRDQLRDKFGIKAIEMEASGVADATWNLDKGYLVVRGICDYCDSRKNDDWQQYAAIAAAAYAYALISSIPSQNSKHISGQQIPPELINQRYRIKEKIGHGQFGAVYKARDNNLDTDVALKILSYRSTSMADNLSIEQRFEREAKTLASLTHPNIMTVLDYGRYNSNLYLAMRYLSGGTLEQRMETAMPYQEAISLLLPIANALAYSHDKGIIHRDVKPSNILFTDNGDPMLSDFGLIKLLGNFHPVLTQAESPVWGTPVYAAPEQLFSEATLQSDIYSLGLILYEMITGQNPFKAKDLTSLFASKLLDESLPRPSQVVPALPNFIEQVILKSVTRNTNERYLSMKAFETDLRNSLGIVSSTQQPLTINQDTPATTPDQIEKEEYQSEVDRKFALAIAGLEENIITLINRGDWGSAQRLLTALESLGEKENRAARSIKRKYKL